MVAIMLQSTAIALMMGFWASLYLIDAFLKSHQGWSRSYMTVLSQWGFSVGVAQVRWYTSTLNRLFLRLGTYKPHLLKAWFTAGVCFGLIAMVASVALLVIMVVNIFSRKPAEQQVLTPVMPGVNLPMSQLGYYLLTLFVCGVLHEAGHAVAAVRERVRVNGFGIFIFILYPGAFVDLYTEHLQVISPMRQLRIYCAGVWHNFVIVLLAIVVLVLLPLAFMPFYTTGHGVAVTSVLKDSPVSGPRGMVAGDHIRSIGTCDVCNQQDWIQCVTTSLYQPSSGYCMPLEQLEQQDISPKFMTSTLSGHVECCGNTSNTHLCFSYHTKTAPTVSHACLPARSTTERPSCRLQSDCKLPNVDSVCVVPSLDNSTKLLKVGRYGRPVLLFLGYPLDLHYSVTLSNYVPAWPIAPLNLPYVLETFCKYLISLSGALALLNVVPCYALDGQWILLAFLEISLRWTSAEVRGHVYTVVLLAGTLLVILNLLIAMWTLFGS